VTVRILQGDCRGVLKSLPDESVHCVVTSPPYWGLRDYGVSGQLGMEATYQEHVETIADVFDEVRRVLRSDGTLWLNYGDSYATSVNGRSAADTKAAGNDDRTFRDKPFSTIQGVLKPKDLCGIPWRVAFALQERGWWLRQDIIWSKPNPMPESVTDRCTKAHEYIFLLSKSERYYYDSEAVAEAAAPGARLFNGGHDVGADRQDNNRSDFTEISSRNKRSVWTVATQPFTEAHFATFPPALIEPCILAGCPEGGTVLDPFGGAGTTGLVADRLKRNAVLIELNPAYAEMAERRIRDDAGMFAEVA
jgi:DNA modification methylase